MPVSWFAMCSGLAPMSRPASRATRPSRATIWVATGTLRRRISPMSMSTPASSTRCGRPSGLMGRTPAT
eukprot:4383773-Lingulodinium_polyedra.AAC.1